MHLILMSLPAWGEWIEIRVAKPIREQTASLPAWGEWIEIPIPRTSFTIT